MKDTNTRKADVVKCAQIFKCLSEKYVCYEYLKQIKYMSTLKSRVNEEMFKTNVIIS
jgi:hypothetical protein